MLKNKTEILDFIICKEKEGRVIPDFFQKVYEINKLIVEDLENTYKQLEQKEEDPSTKIFFRDRRSRFINFWRNYGKHKNWKKMVIDLHDYIKELSYFEDGEDALEPFDINKLKLVCLDFIS
jgi:poly(3-hydroxyalkanoate) synthetase